jgi:drug/metabolite transporter (DMT)-like permease
MGRARWYLLGGAALFSTGGAAVKACDLPAWQVSAWRSAVAAVVLLLVVPAARRGWTGATFLVGLAYAATVTLFVLSNKQTSAASAIFLQSTAPLYLPLLGPLLLRERARTLDLWAGLVMALGLICVLFGDEAASASAPAPAAGNSLAAAAGLCWALTILGLRWTGRTGQGSQVAPLVVGNLIAVAIALPFALPLDPVPATDLGVLLYLGTFQIGLAYVFVSRGLSRVPAMEASLLLLVEPALSPFWAWLLQGEVPSAAVLLGGGLILSTTLVLARLKVRDDQP